MANATLTRPVVTMDLANRSIGRAGLLANRALHPLAAGHFGRQIAPLAKLSDLKIVPTETGIAAETFFGSITIDQPVYSRLLGKAGVSEIDLPKGTSEDTIGDIFRAVTTRTAKGSMSYLSNENISLVLIGARLASPLKKLLDSIFVKKYDGNAIYDYYHTPGQVAARERQDEYLYGSNKDQED